MAQNMQAQPATGLPPFGSFSGGAFDTVNNANLNVHFEIPIIQKAGRGIPFNYSLTYDSAVWNPNYGNWAPVSATWGWTAIPQGATGYISYTSSQGSCFISPTHYYFTIWAGWQYHDTKGVTHNFSNASISNVNTTPCPPSGQPPSSQQATTNDGSGLTLSVAVSGTNLTGFLISRAGTLIGAPLQPQGSGGTITDTNGNQITSTYGSGTTTYYDTLSASSAVLTVTGAGTASSPRVFTYTNPSGGSSAFQMHYTTKTVQTAFGCWGITEYGAQSKDLVTSIVLPDGTSYTINYEPTPGNPTNVTGRIASITLPTGGTINYAYSGGSNGCTGIMPDGSTATLTRTTPDPGGAWTYAHTENGTNWGTVITDPQSNQTVMSFQTIYETQRNVYQGSSSSGTLLKTVDTCYDGSASPCTWTSVWSPFNTVSAITTLPGTTKLLAEKVSTYDTTYGLLREVDEYDWGQGVVGALTRKTITEYFSLGNGIVNRPADVKVETGAGALVAETGYYYDGGSGVVATSGTPQHTSVSGARGNLTLIDLINNVSSWTWISRTFTHFDTGNVQKATDTNGAQTTYTYSDATHSCGNAFPTGVNEPLTMTRSFIWNCDGAVQSSVTDESSNTWTTTYDDAYFWRPKASTDPTNAQTALTYSISPSAWSTESTLNFNGTTSTADTLTTLDSQGRPHVTQRRQSQGSSNYDSVETDYDSLGRTATVTIPYSGTAGQAPGGSGTTTIYDALNRPTQVTDAGGGRTKYTYTKNDVFIETGPLGTGDAHSKRRQLEYDGLGRLTSVCELSSASGSGTCGQTTSQTGFWTKYTYDLLNNLTGVVQNAQSSSHQTRTYQYDPLSRLTSEATPETNGSAYTYVYDTDTTCGTSQGDRVKRTDPVGNVTCYAYDKFHRVTEVTYPSGPYSGVTPEKHFVYDQATVNGVSMSNVARRLAEAYTGPSKTTDLGFSYSSRGEVTDVYQSTPNSGGYYHVSASYWPNGLQNTLNANLSGMPNWTYAADGEGRWNGVSASAGQNPVTATSYNIYGKLTAVSFGSLDSDAFTFDPNTGRMTQYQANVGSYSITGALTWNTNGSLYSLGITDTYQPTNNQTCTYQHDDLARLSSADCGSGNWGQGFTYDPFGNIGKSQLSGHTGQVFSVSYATTTNRITTSGYVYDANGNLTSGSVPTVTPGTPKASSLHSTATPKPTMRRAAASSSSNPEPPPRSFTLPAAPSSR